MGSLYCGTLCRHKPARVHAELFCKLGGKTATEIYGIHNRVYGNDWKWDISSCVKDPRRGWPLTAGEPVTVTRSRQLVAGGNRMTLKSMKDYHTVSWIDYTLITNLMHYYLFVKYYSPLHVSSIKCSSSGGHSCIQAAYGTVTLYKSPGGLSIRSYRENWLGGGGCW